MDLASASILQCWSTRNIQNSSQADLNKFTQDVCKSNLFLWIKLEIYLQISNIHTPYSSPIDISERIKLLFSLVGVLILRVLETTGL